MAAGAIWPVQDWHAARHECEISAHYSHLKDRRRQEANRSYGKDIRASSDSFVPLHLKLTSDL